MFITSCPTCNYQFTFRRLTFINILVKHPICRNPNFGRVWGWHSHSQNGDLVVLWDSQSFRVRLQGQNTSPWSVLHVIGKLLKCRCRKWPHMSHLDIYNTSYGKKKCQESNWQFDSQPLKIRNRPDPNVCRWNATHCCKTIKESYNFASNLIPIRGLSKTLWTHKVLKVQTGTILGLLLGSPGTKSHSDVGATE